MGGSLSCLWTWEGLRHLPSHSSQPLFAPFTRTLLPHSSPNLFRGSPSNSQQFKPRSPALPSADYTPSITSFFLGASPPQLPSPTTEWPGTPGPGLLCCPWGMCPLYIFSAITLWALEPYSCLLPARLPSPPPTARCLHSGSKPCTGSLAGAGEAIHPVWGWGQPGGRAPLLLCPSRCSDSCDSSHTLCSARCGGESGACAAGWSPAGAPHSPAAEGTARG